MDSVAPAEEDIKYVGRKELYTDLGKRMKYIQTFVDFTDDDIQVFNKGSKYLRAAIPTLTHRLYQKMLGFDITARALRTRSSASEAEPEDLFTIDSPHVQRRKIFWKWYLTRLLCSDPSQIEYWSYLQKVGKMHTGKVLMHPLTIEYIHMNACLGYLKDLLIENISTHPDMTVTFKFALIRSLSKVLCIQNDLISRSYMNEGQEYATEESDESNTDNNASLMDTTSNADTASIANSELSTMTQDKQSYPHCLTRGLSNSRPNSAWDTQSFISGRSIDLDRVSSRADTAISSGCPSRSSSHRIAPSVVPTSPSPALTAPFAVGQTHNFETKIWSVGLKRKGAR
ncbi:Protoglobin-domain-containing protein [Aspergillus coremiiformis]|uniref:Protoglobin-domain-containing protein n=1 Tax=Aspergillus coremiiformis TaxID=138285 RepID=A0A5N6ZCE7_9EURO|nr:Protoglobin-domain-containing protein [Aspergillus coremiiformis]